MSITFNFDASLHLFLANWSDSIRRILRNDWRRSDVWSIRSMCIRLWSGLYSQIRQRAFACDMSWFAKSKTSNRPILLRVQRIGLSRRSFAKFTFQFFDLLSLVFNLLLKVFVAFVRSGFWLRDLSHLLSIFRLILLVLRILSSFTKSVAVAILNFELRCYAKCCI